jgi:predicted DNA-binding transcriptional regulator AlpA
MRYLNFSQLRQKLGGRSRSAIYLDLALGRLPQPEKLGGRLYWAEEAIDAHLRALAAESHGRKAKHRRAGGRNRGRCSPWDSGGQRDRSTAWRGTPPRRP